MWFCVGVGVEAEGVIKSEGVRVHMGSVITLDESALKTPWGCILDRHIAMVSVFRSLAFCDSLR